MRDAMTAVEEPLSQAAGVPEVPLVASRPRVWRRLLVGFLLGVIAAILIGAAGLAAWDASYEGRVLPGVRVGGVDLTGMDLAQASATLSDALAGYGDGQLVLHTDAGDVVVAYGAFGRRPDVSWMVAEAMRAGRAGSPVERAAGEVRQAIEGTNLPVSLLVDADDLNQAVRAALAPLGRAPADALIASSAGRIVTFSARDGRTYDAGTAAVDALAAVQQTDTSPEIVIDVAGVAVPPARTDAEVQTVKATAKRMYGALTVVLNDQEWKIKASIVRSWIGFETAADGTVTTVVDRDAIASDLGKVAKGIKQAPQSAIYLKTRSGRIVGVVPSHNGRRLNRRATANAIAVALEQRAIGAEIAPVRAKTVKIEPKLTTAEATKKGPLMARLGVWKTWFPVDDHNYYGANIWTPARIIDGTVLSPGQAFEWWSAIGPVTTARGYGPGGYIAGDHTDPTGALGGGMCSSSTTLFNAAMRAGLQMGSRVNHQYYIYRYPLGLDATVSKSSRGTRTMSFTNDMKHPIVIRSFRYTAGGRGWVRYEIWGIPDGRTVSLSKPAVANVRKAVTNTVVVDTLPHGVRKQTEYPANGMDVSVSRVVRDANGRVIHTNTWVSHYQLWNGVIQVGR
jgi:vancomycin resistance protein YoaR